MGNSQADFLPGANVIAPNGKCYTVTEITDSEKNVRTKICTIEDEHGKTIRVPADQLVPNGQPPAQIAVLIFGKTFTINDCASFRVNDTVYKNAFITDINSKALLLKTEESGLTAVNIADITGISLVY